MSDTTAPAAVIYIRGLADACLAGAFCTTISILTWFAGRSWAWSAVPVPENPCFYAR